MYQCVTYIRYTVGVYFLSQLSSRRNCLCLCTVFIELCCHLAAADDSLVDSDVKKLLGESMFVAALLISVSNLLDMIN